MTIDEYFEKLLREKNEKNPPCTEQLPEIDRVELQRVSADDSKVERVIDAKMLTGAEAQAFAKLWRAQKFDGLGAKCHFPVHAAKFYLDDQVYLYATICWQCDNIYLYRGDYKEIQGFDANGKEGQELLQVFKQTQPEV